MRSLRYEPSASVCALMVATPGLVGWSRIRPLVGEPSRAALGAAGAASPKTRDGGDFGGSTAGGPLALGLGHGLGHARGHSWGETVAHCSFNRGHAETSSSEEEVSWTRRIEPPGV